MAEWNYDINEAPKSKKWIWACVDNKDNWVGKIHWVEPTEAHPDGRWAGLASGQVPLAWTPLLEHPLAEVPS